MLYFESDYLEGAHPKILERLMETNLEKEAGYGADRFSESAKQKIRQAIRCPEAEIHFLVGGTQTNATIIKALLKPYEGVLAADSAHINIHEAGAIEAVGHKILTLPQQFGKIDADSVDRYMKEFYLDENHLHMVKPGMVYITHPTEYGTLYTKQELEELCVVCYKHSLPLYLDGARLGYGLAAKDTDVTLRTISKNCDAFYIGGTKVGALCGEALVITKPQIVSNLYTIIKQQGALLAKGRLLSVQFDTLFTDSLYLHIARHAIEMAEKLRRILIRKGYTLYYESPTNQLFIVIRNKKLEELSQHIKMGFWERWDQESTVVRLATSWATKESDVDALEKLL